MLEVLKSSQGVIAIRVGGRLDEDELEALMTRIEASLEARDKTHMYMEVEDLSGFDVAAFARCLPRGAAMLGKLHRFGRIAVVADQQWIRAWTRIESALLPRISYEVYTSDQREVALAWVEGRSARPRPPGLTLIETDATNVIAFEIDGTIGADELQALTARINSAMKREQPLRLLSRIRCLGGIDAQAVCSSDYLLMKLRALHKVERYVIVGGPAWVRTWLGLVDPLVKMDIRHFAAEDEAAAWAWLEAKPKSERPLAA